MNTSFQCSLLTLFKGINVSKVEHEKQFQLRTKFKAFKEVKSGQSSDIQKYGLKNYFSMAFVCKEEVHNGCLYTKKGNKNLDNKNLMSARYLDLIWACLKWSNNFHMVKQYTISRIIPSEKNN